MAGKSALSGIQFSVGRWSLLFSSQATEDAFLKARRPRMLQNTRHLALLGAIVLLPDVIFYTAQVLLTTRTALPDDGKWVMPFTVVPLFLLVTLLTSLPCVTRSVSFRLCEAFWLGTIVVAVAGSHFILYADLDKSVVECREVQEAGGLRLRLCKEAICYAVVLQALALDAVVTIAHLALPVRWSLMVWVDVLILLTFAHYYSLPASFLDTGYLIAPAVIFAGLVLGACLGLRSSEHRERVLFATVTDERVLRVEAELSAERVNQARSKRPDDAGSTSTMGNFLGQLAATGCSSHELSSLQSMGRREHWLIEPGELVVHRRMLLGRGSFGFVAQGRFCCSPVAVKMFSMKDPSLIDPSFFSELHVLRQLRHPNIVLFHGVDIDVEACDVKLVLERVYGPTLSDFISDLQGRLERQWTFPPELLIAQGLCQALAYMHTRKPCIVHGDLKPTNVMVEECGDMPKAKLLDFGLARVATRNQTITGGTLLYAAPEILDTARPCKPSAAVDVFALGKVLFFVASRRRPDGAQPSDLPWLPPTEFLNSWEETIRACLRGESKERPTMAAIYTRLVLDYEATTVESPATTEPEASLIESSTENHAAAPASLIEPSTESRATEPEPNLLGRPACLTSGSGSETASHAQGRARRQAAPAQGRPERGGHTSL